MSNPVAKKVCLLQDGARRNYAVPVALANAGMLQGMYTDFYATKIPAPFRWLIGKIKPQVAKSLAARQRSGIPVSKVRHFPILARKLRLKAGQFPSSEAFWEWESRQVAKHVIAQGFAGANCFYGYVRNAHPDLFAAAKTAGLHTIADQIIAPAAEEARQVMTQRKRFPQFISEAEAAPDYELVQRLEERTWALSDIIVCGSDYVARSLVEQGLTRSNIFVCPVAPPASVSPVDHQRKTNAPLVVGFVGSVDLRKGVPYIIELAKRFSADQVLFKLVGSVKLKLHADLPSNITFTGKCKKRDLPDMYRSFDVFLFPSTCEGSANSVAEAMAEGLPVIVSPQSGSFARHNIDGYVLPYDDIDAMQRAIGQLANSSLRAQLGHNAHEYVKTLGADNMSNMLSSAIDGLG